LQARNDNDGRPVILFVDDDERLLESLRLILRRSPYEILVTSSVARARRALDQRHVDVIVCDERLAAASGIAFLTELSARSHQAVRILMSGAGVPTERRAELSGAVFRFLSKPTSAREVAIAIEEALAHRTSLLAKRASSVRPSAPELQAQSPTHRTSEPPGASAL
jgi:DNA-binding NtrC family response regulator